MTADLLARLAAVPAAPLTVAAAEARTRLDWWFGLADRPPPAVPIGRALGSTGATCTTGRCRSGR